MSAPDLHWAGVSAGLTCPLTVRQPLCYAGKRLNLPMERRLLESGQSLLRYSQLPLWTWRRRNADVSVECSDSNVGDRSERFRKDPFE